MTSIPVNPAISTSERSPRARARHGLARFASKAGFRQGAMVLADQGFSSLTNFVTGLLVARACSKDQYGSYALGFGLLAIGQMILRSLVGVPYTALSPEMAIPERARYAGSAMVLQVAISFVLAAVLSASGMVAWKLDPQGPMAGMLLGTAGAAIGIAFRDFARMILLARMNVAGCLALGGLANVLTLATLVGAFCLGRLSVPLAFGIVAVGSALPALGLWIAKPKLLTFDRLAIVGHLRRNWNFGRWTLAAVCTGNFCIRVIPWLLLVMGNPEMVASLAAIIATTGLINPAVVGLAEYLTAKMANQRVDEGVGALTTSASRLISFIGLSCVLYMVAMAVWGERLMGLLFTSAFHVEWAAMMLMAMSAATDALNVPLRSLLRAAGRPDIEFRSNVLASAVSLVLAMGLIPSWGLVGATVALLVNRLSLLGGNWVLIRRHVGRTEASTVGVG